MSPIVSQASVGACPRRHAIKVVFNQSVGRFDSSFFLLPDVSSRELSASACVPKSLRNSQRSALSVRAAAGVPGFPGSSLVAASNTRRSVGRCDGVTRYNNTSLASPRKGAGATVAQQKSRSCVSSTAGNGMLLFCVHRFEKCPKNSSQKEKSPPSPLFWSGTVYKIFGLRHGFAVLLRRFLFCAAYLVVF